MPAGQGCRALDARGRDADEICPPEAIERVEMDPADPAGADEAHLEARVSAGSIRWRHGCIVGYGRSSLSRV
jgi:hypothetical protein